MADIVTRTCFYALIVVVSACEKNESSPVSGEAEAIVSAGESSWQISETLDPMTDAQVLQASRQFEQSQYKIDAKVTCSANQLTYEFSTFNAKNEGEEMRRELSGSGTALITPYTVRLDGKDAKDAFEVNSRYSNSLAIKGSVFGVRPLEVAKAFNIALRLQLKSGDVTLKIDQSDTGLRRVLDACIPAAATAVAEAEEPSVASEVSNATDEATRLADELRGTQNKPQDIKNEDYRQGADETNN